VSGSVGNPGAAGAPGTKDGVTKTVKFQQVPSV
jgi:hypothetical protein